jgi:tol-pal system protein YbgF
MSCASSKKSASADTPKETSEAESTNSERLAAMAKHLDFLSKRIDLLDSLTYILPIALISENQLQIALLREEVTFLRKFLENQNHVPLVNPSRQRAPDAAGPVPPEYDKAQFLFNQKNYEAAAKQFEKVTVLYPRSDWAGPAWYWAGESQMKLGNFALAISAFEKVFFYPESIKQADAQFQIGICLLRMGSREHAATAFRKVQEFYPRSPRALQAQAELKKMN